MFQWVDFLRLAEDLASRSGDEAAERTAISRSYYAAFGLARAYLRSSGVDVPAAGHAHAVVWDRFHANPDPLHRRIADLGRRLRRRRALADYDGVYANASADAISALTMAQQLVADLDRLP